MEDRTDVAAFVWPAYTGDELRSRMFWPEGIGEWQSVKNSARKENGYHWNRKPLWGYVNEADPYVMQMEIDAAADHGVNVFIYDWYWYDRRPFLEQCLDNGFLKAGNRSRMSFYLMWANHDANNVWNIALSDELAPCVVWEGSQDWEQYRTVVRRVIDRYFRQPNYYRLDGKPVFMIYDLPNLVKGLGGVEGCRRGLDYFRDETVKAGFPGLHLQATAWRMNGSNLSGVDGSEGGLSRKDFDALGFDSITHYQFVHFTGMDRGYPEILGDVAQEWANIDANYGIPYFPHVSIGWDNNPRFKKFIPCQCRDNGPENFEKGMLMARDYLDRHPGQHRLVTINSWNEWTETSYLEPDSLHGYGYLDTVKKIFG